MSMTACDRKNWVYPPLHNAWEKVGFTGFGLVWILRHRSDDRAGTGGTRRRGIGGKHERANGRPACTIVHLPDGISPGFQNAPNLCGDPFAGWNIEWSR